MLTAFRDGVPDPENEEQVVAAKAGAIFLGDAVHALFALMKGGGHGER